MQGPPLRPCCRKRCRQRRTLSFVAIQEHKQAFTLFRHALDGLNRVEKLQFAEQPYSQAEIDAAEAAEHACGEAVRDAERTLASNVPTTAVGLLAALEYERLGSIDGEMFFDEDDIAEFLFSIETAIRNLLAGA